MSQRADAARIWLLPLPVICRSTGVKYFILLLQLDRLPRRICAARRARASHASAPARRSSTSTRRIATASSWRRWRAWPTRAPPSDWRQRAPGTRPATASSACDRCCPHAFVCCDIHVACCVLPFTPCLTVMNSHHCIHLRVRITHHLCTCVPSSIPGQSLRVSPSPTIKQNQHAIRSLLRYPFAVNRTSPVPAKCTIWIVLRAIYSRQSLPVTTQ